MADIDIDPFGECESRPEEPTGESIPLIPGEERVPTWNLGHVQETSFVGESEAFKEEKVKELYQLLGNETHQRLEPCLDLFEFGEGGRLYYKGNPLTNRNGELKVIGVIADTLGIGGLQVMGFNISRTNLKPRYVLDLLEKLVELPSADDIAKADAIEMEEFFDSTENLIS